jgi:ABC-2 type transport system ATP-binding protein
LISTFDLTKRFRNITAVNNLSITVKNGEIYGLLGPNGSGKTTTIKLLLGILRPTSGVIKIFGEEFNPNKLHIKEKIGVVPEKHPFDLGSSVNALDYLNLFAGFYNVKNKVDRIESLLHKVNLYEVRKRKINEYSRGMLQKLSIIRALLPEPEILFLDEPISGLDPIGIKQIRDLIKKENENGKTIIISSHLLSEVENICHRFAIIHKGRLLIESSLEEINIKLKRKTTAIIEVEYPDKSIKEKLEKLHYVEKIVMIDNCYHITVNTNKDVRKELAGVFINAELTPLSINIPKVSLEEAFITLTDENISLFTGTDNGI